MQFPASDDLASASALSPRQLTPLRTGTLRKQSAAHGAVVHTTGSGVVMAAQKAGKDPFERALSVYSTGLYFPHYIIGWAGELGQICDERIRAPHVGVTPIERTAFLNNTWRTLSHPIGCADYLRNAQGFPQYAYWDARWPSLKAPTELVPGHVVSEVFLGIELLDARQMSGNSGKPYTDEQYKSLGRLLVDVAKRHGFPIQKERILGHDDLNPITRSTRAGGWDPGSYGSVPAFDWAHLFSLIH